MVLRSEAMRALISRYPDRSLTIQVNDQNCRHDDGRRTIVVTFSVFVQPGLGPLEACTLFKGKTLEEAVAKALSGDNADHALPADELDDVFNEPAPPVSEIADHATADMPYGL